MSNELMIIEERIVLGKDFKIYGDIETPLFLAKDVAEWIEHSNVTDMISRIDTNEVTKLNLGGLQGVCNFLTEDGLYEVLMQSRKPMAKEFKKQVKEILKQIRKTGGYIPIKDDETESELMARALLVASKTIELKQQRISQLESEVEEMKPLSDFGKHVSESYNTIDIGEFAKVVKNENLDIGRNRLFDFLRSKKILMSNNVPYQKYMENKWFEVIETVRETHYGTKIFCKTLITGKGQLGVLKIIKECL